MKTNHYFRYMVLGGIATSLLFVGLGFRGERSSLVLKVHAKEGCSVASVKGAYGFFRTGTTPAGPLAAVGFATFDGTGVATGRQTIRRNGVTTLDLFKDRPPGGRYEIDSDCAGRFLDPDGSVFVVVVDGGKEFFFTSISLVPANTVTGVAKKINSHRNHEED